MTDSGLGKQLANAVKSGDSKQALSLAESLLSNSEKVETKLTKNEANYRHAESDKDCEACKYFHMSSCDIVAGEIRPNDVCDKWEADAQPKRDIPEDQPMEATSDDGSSKKVQ